jgi:hypothetical protein
MPRAKWNAYVIALGQAACPFTYLSSLCDKSLVWRGTRVPLWAISVLLLPHELRLATDLFDQAGQCSPFWMMAQVL